MRYQHRLLRVTLHDKHSANYDRRRGGDKVDRSLELDDSATPQHVHFTDEQGDDFWAFQTRADYKFLEYLNELGAEGWQMSYTYSGSHGWPFGIHVLTRQTE